MRRLRRVFLSLTLLAFYPLGYHLHAQEEVVRVATYNIKFLSTAVAQQGQRLNRLKTVIELLDADVIGLQEIADRRALELLFPPAAWQIVIDDDSNDVQDVALVVRRPLRVLGLPADLDADDEHFAFPGAQENSLFPGRRDLLMVRVGLPESDQSFIVFVVHAKARVGGRANTDARREGAARAMIRLFEREFDEEVFVVMGDFNDTPDDRSLNILETGDPDAPGGTEEIEGPFLVNITEPLYARGHVSFGRSSANIVQGRIDTVDPESRDRNDEARGTNENTGDALFDQILIPVRVANLLVQGSARVFDNPAAVEGGSDEQASDHLPVSAELALGAIDDEEDDEPEALPSLRIAALLPNPQGDDKGREEIRIKNPTATSVTLSGWTLQDRAGNTFQLTGTLAPGVVMNVRIPDHSMPLNNSGDDVSLIDPGGVIRHHVTYSANEVVVGQRVEIPD